MRRFFARLANLFNHQKAERELAREIEAHLAMMQDDFERRGLPPEEAKLAVRRSYGGIEQAKELHREARKHPDYVHGRSIHRERSGAAVRRNGSPLAA